MLMFHEEHNSILDKIMVYCYPAKRYRDQLQHLSDEYMLLTVCETRMRETVPEVRFQNRGHGFSLGIIMSPNDLKDIDERT